MPWTAGNEGGGREGSRQGRERGRRPVLNAQDGEPSRRSPRDGSSVSTSGGRGALARGNYHYHHYGRCSLIGSCGRDEGRLSDLLCYYCTILDWRRGMHCGGFVPLTFFPCSLCISRFQIDQNEYPTSREEIFLYGSLSHRQRMAAGAATPMGELTNN